MSSVIRDPMFDLTLARWDCVNGSGPCDCDNGVNAARVASQHSMTERYVEKRAQYPVEPIIGQPGWKPKRSSLSDPAPKVGYWTRLVAAIFGRSA